MKRIVEGTMETKSALFILFLLSLIGCGAPSLHNPADPGSEEYLTLQIIRCALGESGALCLRGNAPTGPATMIAPG